MKRAMGYVILSGLFDKMVGKSKILGYRQGGFERLYLFARNHRFTSVDWVLIKFSMSSGRNSTMPFIPQRPLRVVDFR